MSKEIAEALRLWFPAVIQAVRPYYSPDDITKGARWSSEIASILDESRVGIICVTRDNLDAPWVMFEAGALSKNLERSKVTPVLFGVEPTDLTGPLVQFQAARFDKAEIRRVIRMVNSELGDGKLASDVLDTVFEMWWPRLEEKIQGILAAQDRVAGTAVRSQRDILEEILSLSRVQARRSIPGGVSVRATMDLVEAYAMLIEQLRGIGLDAPLRETLERLYLPIQHIVRRTNLKAVNGEPVLPRLYAVRASLNEAAMDTDAPATEPDIDEDDLPF